MIKNFFKVSFRNLIRHKFYTTINVVGLSIGIAVSMLILFFIYDELSYDRFHKDAERIYQVYQKARLQGKEGDGPSSCAPFASAAVHEIPEVESSIRINLWREQIIRYEDDVFTETMLLADSNFFRFFTFELLEGNPENILNEPNQIVLTKKTAKKYFDYDGFGDESPVGKMVVWGTGKSNCEIVGIMADPPSNSHFHFDIVLSMQTWEWSKGTQWTSNSLYTYIKLNEHSDPNATQEKIKAMVDKYIGPEIQQYLGVSLEQWRQTGDDYGYFFQPMLDIHLRNKVEGNIEPTGNISYIYLLSIISIFIIVIACINFMNLATARSTGRAREVGVRKTVGASKNSLVGQFLLESMLITALSTLLAVVLIYIALPFFNQITGKQLDPAFMFTGTAIISLVAIMIVAGLLAGSYPAFYLTIFKPAEVLKGKVLESNGKGWVRRILVVFQFTISVGLIVSTLIIYKQLKLVQNKNLGFDKENVLIIDNVNTLDNNKQLFVEALRDMDHVVDASISDYIPPHIYSNSVYFPNGDREQTTSFFTIYADQNYQETLGLSMYSGRYFSPEFPSDSSAVVINKTGMEIIGWESHEGNYIEMPSNDGNQEIFNVVGIFDDFNFASLHSEIEPLIVFLIRPERWTNLISVRIKPGDISQTTREIEEKWKEMAPGEPFDYSYLDENFDALFKSEKQMGEIFIIFTILAIFIASLGLFGLATFMAEQRSKEIGIRKAMGATVGSVMVLLSKEFTRLVLVSVVLATPAIIILMNWWLENFAYKTKIDFMSFLAGGLIALFISLCTVSYQSIKAAIANPTIALRYE
jgi:putative ABC transport system permease protein